MQTVIQDITDGAMTQAATFFTDFSPLILTLVGLLVFLMIVGAFIGFLRGRS